jgi:hypothetical protein
MTDQAPTENTAVEQQAEARDDREPDESTLLGESGVEEEVLAELARAEARLSDPSAADDPDATGAQV